jgi:hypothetical protein
MMNQQQWQQIEAIVRNKQVEYLHRGNYKQYNDTKELLKGLYSLAHGEENAKVS